jgi:hypothetical protein
MVCVAWCTGGIASADACVPFAGLGFETERPDSTSQVEAKSPQPSPGDPSSTTTTDTTTDADADPMDHHALATDRARACLRQPSCRYAPEVGLCLCAIGCPHGFTVDPSGGACVRTPPCFLRPGIVGASGGGMTCEGPARPARISAGPCSGVTCPEGMECFDGGRACNAHCAEGLVLVPDKTRCAAPANSALAASTADANAAAADAAASLAAHHHLSPAAAPTQPTATTTAPSTAPNAAARAAARTPRLLVIPDNYWVDFGSPCDQVTCPAGMRCAPLPSGGCTAFCLPGHATVGSRGLHCEPAFPKSDGSANVNVNGNSHNNANGNSNGKVNANPGANVGGTTNDQPRPPHLPFPPQPPLHAPVLLSADVLSAIADRSDPCVGVMCPPRGVCRADPLSPLSKCLVECDREEPFGWGWRFSSSPADADGAGGAGAGATMHRVTDTVSGRCVRPCHGVECPHMATCAAVAGQCVAACPSGMLMDETNRRCIADPCAGVRCPKHATCEASGVSEVVVAGRRDGNDNSDNDDRRNDDNSNGGTDDSNIDANENSGGKGSGAQGTAGPGYDHGSSAATCVFTCARGYALGRRGTACVKVAAELDPREVRRAEAEAAAREIRWDLPVLRPGEDDPARAPAVNDSQSDPLRVDSPLSGRR